MKAFAYKMLADGTVRIIYCKGNPKAYLQKPDIVSGDGTSGDPYVYAAVAELIGELPKDASGAYIKPTRAFRGCWTEDGSGGIEVDLTQAREQKMKEVRADRDQKLKENDQEWLIASKKGESTTVIETAANTLRDAPASAQTEVDAITDLEELENYKAQI